jgi:hypothetical protein
VKNTIGNPNIKHLKCILDEIYSNLCQFGVEIWLWANIYMCTKSDVMLDLAKDIAQCNIVPIVSIQGLVHVILLK